MKDGSSELNNIQSITHRIVSFTVNHSCAFSSSNNLALH